MSKNITITKERFLELQSTVQRGLFRLEEIEEKENLNLYMAGVEVGLAIAEFVTLELQLNDLERKDDIDSKLVTRLTRDHSPDGKIGEDR